MGRPKPPKEIRTQTGPVEIGGLIRYYRDGWYCGYLQSIGTATAKILPIGPKGSAQRGVNVPIEDVRAP